MDMDRLSLIKALQMIEDMLLEYRDDKDAWLLHSQQGHIFRDFPGNFTFLLAAVECFVEDPRLLIDCARSLYDLAKQIGSALYHKKALKKAKECLKLAEMLKMPYQDLEMLLKLFKDAELSMAASMTLSVKDADSKIAASKVQYLRYPKPRFWNTSPEPDTDEVKELRLYWMGLDDKIKQDFMKISIEKLKSFVKGRFNREVEDTLEQVLTSAKKDKKWIFWMCRTSCAKKFSNAEEYKRHVELEHAANLQPSLENYEVKRIGKDWARKISVGDWEPLDAKAAAEMIKNQLEDVKAFASKSKNGWSKEWPLAVDKERSELLQEIKLLLVSLYGLKILPGSIRDWVMLFPVKHLGNLVPKQSLTDSRIAGTPQSICFLEYGELCQIRDFLTKVQCERHDGTDIVCEGVDGYVNYSQIKEKMDFDSQFSYLLLDRRLLKSNNATYDDDKGTINTLDPSLHYAKATVQGDGIISWLVDYPTIDGIFPRPRREHNLDCWVAVMKAVQFTCRSLRTRYAKKVQVSDYEAALTDVENLCREETKSRENLQEDQWNRYASLLCDRCEENTVSAKLFLCAVRDVLEGASHLTFDFPNLEECLNLIRGRKSLSDAEVLQNIDRQKSVVTHKALLTDSKILLIDNSRISLLNSLTRLSLFDNRIYMLQLLKPFLMHELVNMERKAKSDAARAELILEEEKKSKKKENKRNKKSSTSMRSPLDKTIEQESSAPKLQPEATSPPLEESIEPNDTLASERSLQEILSNTDNEVDPGMQNMPGENSLSEHLELAHGAAAATYNSALDMTLKALLNINLLTEDLKNDERRSHDDRREQVTRALQEVCTAFKSEMVEGVYSVHLSDVLSSLKDVIPMSGGAVGVFETLLQSWPCWKDSETESLVTSLFMLEENARMSCRKCTKANDSKRNSYHIVMAADSVRDLKYVFGNMKFVDILKFRKENKILCDVNNGGCGETNLVLQIIRRYPPVFTIVLEWEKSDAAKEISETTKALEWEIDISRLYKGEGGKTNYRLVSMVGCGEEDEHFCLAYGNNRWFSFMRDSLAKKDVGTWENVLTFCEERKVRPEILFYQAASALH